VKNTIRTVAGLFLAATCAIVPAIGAAGPARAAANTDRLTGGEQLNPGERLISPNGQFVLTMQGDGNLVEYAPGNRAVWATGTNRADSIARMQTDGNLVVIAPGNVAVWATGTGGNPGADVELQNDGNVVVYASGHVARWGSGTQSGSSSLADRITTIARNEAGNPNHNHENGANCNYYSGALGGGTACGNNWRAEEWCADFARWTWGQAGANTGGLSAAAISFQTYGNAHATWHAGSSLSGVQPGDVVGYNFGGSTSDDHVGIVVATAATTVTTVEGNYSDAVTTRTVTLGTSGLSGYTHPVS
jgi:hypothetical protein